MKDAGGFAGLDYPYGVQYYSVAVVGAGAAAPVAPTDSPTQPGYPKKCNVLSRLAAEIPTRSGAGAYVITVDTKFMMNKWLSATAEVYGATGAWAQVSALNAATRQITVKVFNAAGTPTDLANGTDLLVIDIRGQDGNG